MSFAVEPHRPNGLHDQDVRKIAVLRANALGDFIFILPALDALRAAYPGAEIVLLGLPWHVAFLAGRPSPVDRVVAIPPYPGVSALDDAPEAPEAIATFFDRMHAERFDLAVQLHGGGRHSNPFTLRLGAKETVGLRTPDAAPLDRWVPYVYFQSEVLRFLEVVGLVGAAPVTLEPRLTVTAADRAEAALRVPPLPEPLVVLHPGAGDIRRRWPPEKFAAVGDALAREGARVAVTGIATEAAIVRAVVERMAAPALDLSGVMTLGGLAGLLERADVVVSNDSGPLHLAGAVGTPTVGIYWCGNLINAGPATRSRHRPVLSWRLACPICGFDCTTGDCGHRPSYVADVPVDDVVAQAVDLLAARRADVRLRPAAVEGYTRAQ